jgi:hypothetical protein
MTTKTENSTFPIPLQLSFKQVPSPISSPTHIMRTPSLLLSSHQPPLRLCGHLSLQRPNYHRRGFYQCTRNNCQGASFRLTGVKFRRGEREGEEAKSRRKDDQISALESIRMEGNKSEKSKNNARLSS